MENINVTTIERGLTVEVAIRSVASRLMAVEVLTTEVLILLLGRIYCGWEFTVAFNQSF